ncbi:gamma subclass chorismate mutase AroQ [Micromonospora sp. NPDC051227]|uniref:gamma subclass chorismate mutase AroQ n=1 Tax=Micromonospora sp. NPDC051227 TaxID=3364285 RepID=UPI00379138D9
MEWSDLNSQTSADDVDEQESLLTALAAERLALGDKVAAAKYGSTTPINDEAREERLLADVVARSREIGLDPLLSRRFFRAQIEANKVLQRRLYAVWSDHPELRPRCRPNLESEVRPQLDVITRQMLLRLKALESARKAAHRVDGTLHESLRGLHEEALRIAFRRIRGRADTNTTSDSSDQNCHEW